MSTIPSDPIKAVFSDEVVDRLRARQLKSERLQVRLAVLAAGTTSEDDRSSATVAPPAFLRAMKAAWEIYLEAAFSLGLFDGESGKELRSRLTGRDDDLFRGAMAECMVGWVLAGKLKLITTARPEGRRQTLEFLVHCESGNIGVEVKSPYRPLPDGAWRGDDSDLLAGALASANEQFAAGVRNLLVLAPSIRMPIHLNRSQLIRALYGQQVIEVPIDQPTGEPIGPERVQFRPDGSFLNPLSAKGKPIKSDGTPPYTRVGAVLCVEDSFKQGNPPLIEHEILLAHNPFASDRLPQDIWGTIPQFREVAERMAWSDGAPAL